jgi:hypothetical protein
MSKFMLLAYGQNLQPQISAEEAQRITQRYIDWTNNLKQQGRLHSTAKLAEGAGRELRAQGAEVIITDGPHLESKELLGGYWVIEAADYDEALALVKEHPHLALGGNLTLRALDHI